MGFFFIRGTLILDWKGFERVHRHIQASQRDIISKMNETLFIEKKFQIALQLF